MLDLKCICTSPLMLKPLIFFGKWYSICSSGKNEVSATQQTIELWVSRNGQWQTNENKKRMFDNMHWLSFWNEMKLLFQIEDNNKREGEKESADRRRFERPLKFPMHCILMQTSFFIRCASSVCHFWANSKCGAFFYSTIRFFFLFCCCFEHFSLLWARLSLSLSICECNFKILQKVNDREI